ncbi:MAG: SLBB domain-containing protein [Armatimonadota bacterium]|nr:SLBB domain-containing protein [bacterium]MDW8321366.1 SLBB domain-containing protein [Armatimonadota bacterium]
MRKAGVFLTLWILLGTLSFAQTGQQAPSPTSPALLSPGDGAGSKEAKTPAPVNNTPATLPETRARQTTPLEKFGYSYFKQAREAITLRRLYFQMLLQGTLQSSPLSMIPPEQPSLPEQKRGEAQAAGQDTFGSSKQEATVPRSRPAQQSPGERGATQATTPQQPRTSSQALPADVPQSPVSGETQQPSLSYPAVPHQPLPSATTPFVMPPADALKHFVGPDAMSWMNVLAPAPERYQLGAGDGLTLRYWNDTLEPQEVYLRVDAQGAITLPMGGKIVARGQTLQQLEETVHKAMSRVIRNVRLTLTLRELRTMTVIVAGEAYAPGSYQMPAVATLFNALYACGGPSDNGSLRRIQLKRTDGSVHTFDFYRFLLNGDGSQDIPLQPGDVIFIPPVEVQVSVSGEVHRPAIYELLPKERLRDAIGFAGGVKPSGVVQRVAVASVRPGEARQLIDANLLESGEENNPPLYDGDSVEVYSIRPIFANIVTVDGAVDQPGNYALTQGMTVADLIERARGLLEDAYVDRADLFRTNPDNTQTLIPVPLTRALQRDPQANIPLQRRDRLVVYAIKDVEWMGDRRVEARGAVQKPRVYYRADNMRVQDLLLQAGGVLPNAYVERAFLQRRNPDGSYGTLLALDLRKAMLNDPDHNVPLQDRDVLMVYTREQAQFTPENVVTIDGAIQSPGTYPRAQGMRLADLIRLAGGPLPEAAARVEIAKARKPAGTPPVEVSLDEALKGSEAQNPLLEDGDVVTVRARGDFRLKPMTVYLRGAVKEPGPYTLQASTERLSDIVKRAGGLLDTAYPQAARLLRRPEQVISDLQKTLTGRILQVLRIVNEEEYRRELARSDVERVRFAAGLAQPATPVPASASALLGQTVSANPAAAPEKIAEAASLFTRDLVSQARPLKEEDLLPAGNVRIDLVTALRKPGSEADVEVRDGDIIYVPERPTTVAVTGAVVVPSAVLHVPGKRVSYYIEYAGGFTADAARDRILVIRATGEVLPAQKVRAVELGDIIFVPTRVMAERLRDRQAEIDAAIRSITTGAIVFRLIETLVK